MKIGMLWADFSKIPFAEKCNGAIKYFTDKYGVQPTAIVVHPNTAIQLMKVAKDILNSIQEKMLT